MTGVTHTARPTERSELPPSRDRGTVAALRRFLSADVITSDQALRSGALIALASASAGLRVALGVTQAVPWLVGSGIGALALLAVHQIGVAAMTDRYRGVMRSVLAGYASLLIAARWIPQGPLGALDPLGILDIALNVGVLAMLAGEHAATSRPAPAAATAAAMPAHPATRGVRGATTVEHNTREAVLAATHELLERIVQANGMQTADIASALFSTTPDIDAVFPAVAARERGWTETALMCTHEMAVPGSLPRCIRVLIHWNTTLRAAEVHHVYLRGARVLRPDLASPDTPEPSATSRT
jgi:chorismate mutase